MNLEDRIRVDGRELQLNGLALRTRFIFKVYVAGLYLPAKATSANEAIYGKGPKRIILVMMRDATAEQFFESIDGGTTLFVDGVAQGKPMAGEPFFQALLRIWLGEDPVQADLKEALLGGEQ